MALVLNEEFVKYLGEFSTKMTDENSSFHVQLTKIEEQVRTFGLTNEQFGKLISEVHAQAMQYITQFSNQSAVEVLKMQTQQPIWDIELQIKEKELEIKDKELEIKDKQLEMMVLDVQIKEEQLKIEREKLKLTMQQIEESKQKVLLMKEQTNTEKEQTKMVAAQERLVTRQELGYNDNLYVKAAEFQGSLASFAVNAAPTNPTTNTAIQNFTTTINEIKRRGK